MQLIWYFAFLLLGSHYAAAKAVFAHFMVDNTEDFTIEDWTVEMSMAITAHIDAFALNIASGRSFNDAQISNAFSAANAEGFKLFFSFDYASEGAWDKAAVTALLQQYTSNGAYFHTADTSQPLVSTFEGPASAADWVEIKQATGCFFIPDWSSYGANAAIQLEGGVADGLFNWAAWPYDGERMNTYVDASYLQYLGKKPYMMAASPWFYTNLPGFKKNWAWPDISMSLWSDRWTEILLQQPDYVEIISWNDFGESHYIGRARPSPPFMDGDATFDYVTDMDHIPWTWPLAVWADQYKHGKATVTEESLVLEYLLHSPLDCSDGGTTINTASQLQVEQTPADVMDYKYIGFTATLGSLANITINIGGQSYSTSWQSVPAGGVGVYHGSLFVPTTATGTVSADLIRNGQSILTVTGESIGGCTEGGYANFNPWVGGDFVPGQISVETPHDLSELVCIEGTGTSDFAELCSVVCEYGYCPISACVCTAVGLQKDYPVFTGDKGYALSDPNYEGLCEWTYQYGYTFPDHCSTTEQNTVIPSVSPFLPESCTGGQAAVVLDGLRELCSFTCSLGYCPIHLCLCTSYGALVLPDSSTQIPDVVEFEVNTNNTDQMALCSWSCSIGGYCPCVTGSDSDDSTCDYSLQFSDLDTLIAAADGFSTYCAYIYLLDVLQANLTASLAEYNDANNGYDKLFGYYETYIKDEIPSTLDTFMGWDDTTGYNASAPGNQYFSCTYYDATTKKNGTTQPCPSAIENEFGSRESSRIYYELVNSTGFYEDLQNNYGIEPDWVEFGVQQSSYCVGGTFKVTTCTLVENDNYGYPLRSNNVTVPNPKDIFTDAGPAMGELPDRIIATRLDMILGQYGGSGADAIAAYAMPVAMVAQAIQSMDQVKVIGKTEEQAEKKRLIALILTAVLGVVPFVGEEAAALAGLVSLSRGIAIAGGIANEAYGIYGLVQDPSSGVMSALGLLLGLGSIAAATKDAAGLSKIAALRREMTTDDVAAMGATVEEQATSIQKLLKSCTL